MNKDVAVKPVLMKSAIACLAIIASWPAWSHEGGGIGKAGIAAQVDRTVNVNMTDAMRFEPARIDVRQGETIRFVVTNSGKLRHEFVLGSAKALQEHEALMKKFPGMEHDEPNMVSVEPASTGEVIWRFTRAGSVGIACLQPGHYDAGMKGLVNVRTNAAGRKHTGH